MDRIQETLESGIPSSPNSGSRSNEFPEQQQQQQLQEPSESLQTTINEATPPESEWVISMKEKLEWARQDNVASSWDKLSIYKIPHYLRVSSGDDKANVPQIVSLGPYHHGKSRLPQMECHKWRSLDRVLKRTNHDVSLYLDSMKEIEERARSCYEGPISLSSNEFVEMLVLDGCFVLELFRGATAGFTELGYSRNDPVFAIRGSMPSIQRDMILLENQLPLFVLDRLLGIQLGNPDKKGIVANLALRFFYPLMPTDEPLTEKLESDRSSLESDLHCLDVFRKGLLHRGPRGHRVADKRRQQLIHCVTELKEAGIKFKKSETGRFWDIKFKDGTLRMPQLFIHDGTKSLFLNLIAFEQCHMGGGNDITSYVFFMDNLINSPADVGYLHYHGIIEHWLGQEVVVDINDSYLSPLSEAVNQYYDRKWNKWCASLRHNYFSNPWAIISLAAAVVLLLLTFAQTYYTIYEYYKPSR